MREKIISYYQVFSKLSEYFGLEFWEMVEEGTLNGAVLGIKHNFTQKHFKILVKSALFSKVSDRQHGGQNTSWLTDSMPRECVSVQATAPVHESWLLCKIGNFGGKHSNQIFDLFLLL